MKSNPDYRMETNRRLNITLFTTEKYLHFLYEEL